MRITCVLALMCWASLGHAEEVPEPLTYDGRVISSINYEIDGTLDTEAFERALRLRVGDPYDAAAWQADVQSLLNLGFLRRVETEPALVGDDSVQLNVRIRTNWALLPFLGFEGGAVPVLILGASYANAFGSMVEVGGYYMRRGPYNLGRAWLMVPQKILPRSLLDIELVLTGDTVAFFPSNPTEANDAQRERYGSDVRWRLPANGVEVLRRGGYADFGYQPIADWLTLSLRYGLFHETQVELTNLPAVMDAEARGVDIELGRGRRREAMLSLVSATALVGQVDLIDNYILHGHEARAVVIGSSKYWGSARDFAWLYFSYRGFTRLSERLIVAKRLTLAHSTSDDPVDDWNLGGSNLEPFIYGQRHPGLLSVRGLRPHQFRGQEMVFANIEPRFTILREQSLPIGGDMSLQLAAFVDVGRAWTGEAFSEGWRNDSALIVGGGLLLTLLDFRYTYVNWYVGRVIAPFPDTALGIVVMRQFF